jgi:hypothetical protein
MTADPDYGNGNQDVSLLKKPAEAIAPGYRFGPGKISVKARW